MVFYRLIGILQKNTRSVEKKMRLTQKKKFETAPDEGVSKVGFTFII